IPAQSPMVTAAVSPPGRHVVAHVATDNMAGGKLAAQFIARTSGETGDVGIVGQPEVQTTIDREAGFREAMKAYPKISIVASISGAGVRDRALKAADDMFQAHPTISGIFAINDESALGVLASAQSQKTRKVDIVGYA